MIVLVTDPITNTIVTKPKDHPFLVCGDGRHSTKIYFESEENKERYIQQNSTSFPRPLSR